MALGAVESVRALMDELGEAAGLSPAVLAPVLKTVGIAILTHISAEVCRDAKGERHRGLRGDRGGRRGPVRSPSAAAGWCWTL